MDFYLDQLLNLPNVTVASCQQQEGFIFLTLDFLNQREFDELKKGQKEEQVSLLPLNKREGFTG